VRGRGSGGERVERWGEVDRGRRKRKRGGEMQVNEEAGKRGGWGRLEMREAGEGGRKDAKGLIGQTEKIENRLG